MDGTGFCNWHFAGWSKDGWTVEFYRWQNSPTDFTRRKPATFGWWWRRRRVLAAAALRFSTARWSTLPSKNSAPTSQTSSYFSWWQGGGSGMSWGVTLPPSTHRPQRTSLWPSNINLTGTSSWWLETSVPTWQSREAHCKERPLKTFSHRWV